MVIHKFAPSVYYNYCLKHLNTKLNEPTNKNSIKVTKDGKPTNNTALSKNFGDYFL